MSGLVGVLVLVVAAGVLGGVWVAIRRNGLKGIAIVAGVLVLAVLLGPELVGYHHCTAGDYLLGAHGFSLFGTAWCK